MIPRTANRSAAPRGFTLIEVLLALGILAVGLAMAAALFPTAIKKNEQSIRDSLGTIICQAGYGTAVSKIKRADVTGDTLGAIAHGGKTDVLDDKQQRYPCDDADSGRGFAVLGRRLDPDGNAATGGDPGYQLVIVSYSRVEPTSDVTLRTLNATINAGESVATVNSGGGWVRMNSPLILAETGEYAMIIDVQDNGNTVVLDRAFSSAVDDKQCYVLVEDGQDALSPALSVMVIRTALPR